MRFDEVHIRTAPHAGRAQLRALYGGQEPRLFAGTRARPLASVAVYRSGRGPHWHYVTFGLARPGSDGAGLGLELTFRLAAGGEGAPPAWPVELLAAIARHALGVGLPPRAGHYLRLLDGPVRAAALVEEPELGPVEAPGARFGWLQAVGLHEDELPAMAGDGYAAFLEELAARDALLLTRPGRPPIVRAG